MSAAPSTGSTVWRMTFGLALASAVSLGLARFAYSLLLPAMRDDLGWSYATAGLMNTVNAAGYLIGALLLPRWQARFDGRSVVLAGGFGAAAALAAHAALDGTEGLLVVRTLSGIASAASFAGGGLLAARLAQQVQAEGRSGLVLGVYYGGTGLGIIVSSLLVPWLEGWRVSWLALGGVALVSTVLTTGLTSGLEAPRVPRRQDSGASAADGVRSLAWAMAGYLMFGLGYIGYMTFVIALAREQGLEGGALTAFYALLGAAVVASSWIWAGLLQRHRGGRPLATLNGLLALACALPVLVQHPVALFASGLLFGSVFLSVVASTTALVRHNLAASEWPAGIAVFTVIFAGGQIVGPLLVGWASDALGAGLTGGFALSAALLAAGSMLAAVQRPRVRPTSS